MVLCAAANGCGCQVGDKTVTKGLRVFLFGVVHLTSLFFLLKYCCPSGKAVGCIVIS
ncbi:hypothetical protein EXN66_Car004246 [Channa argus]|uniref:Uncharacterized protein n=1 Tax=Channa argus TaxID=215402 RepID=A0A6G1PEL9_CHAAH|nr:hypothetical protein EXN66_Car004246 [Channa argus]